MISFIEDIRPDEEVIRLTDGEEVIRLTDGEEVIRLTDDEEVVRLTDGEEVVRLTDVEVAEVYAQPSGQPTSCSQFENECSRSQKCWISGTVDNQYSVASCATSACKPTIEESVESMAVTRLLIAASFNRQRMQTELKNKNLIGINVEVESKKEKENETQNHKNQWVPFTSTGAMGMGVGYMSGTGRGSDDSDGGADSTAPVTTVSAHISSLSSATSMLVAVGNRDGVGTRTNTFTDRRTASHATSRSKFWHENACSACNCGWSVEVYLLSFIRVYL